MRLSFGVALLIAFFGCGGDDAPNPLPDAPLPPIDMPAGDLVAPIPGTGLTFSALTTSSVTVTWGAATDDVTAPAALRYKLVRASTAAELDTVEKAQAISGSGIVLDFAPNTLTANATGLTAATGFAFAVVVRDDAGNAALYTPATVATLDSGAPTVGTGITFTNINATDVTVNWGAASDDNTAVALLEYKVVRAATVGEIDTLAEIAAITSGAGLVMDFTANTLTALAAGLTSSSVFAFAVVVRDHEGNEAIYTPATTPTADITAPVPGDPITFTAIAANTLTVNWGAATDDVSAQANLEYKVVHGVDVDAIDTLAEAGAVTGADLVLDFTANTLTANAIALAPSTTHAFAVVVRDESGNEALYVPATATTTNEAPVVNSTAPPTATEDTLYTYNATRTDADGPGQTWSTLVTHTCGGSIDAGTGVFTFTPAGPAPSASCVLAIQVCDGGTPDLCGEQTTTITITAVNDAPVIDSVAPTTAIEDTLFTYAATRNDTDGPAQTWSLLGTHTCGGSIVAATGVVTFTIAGPVPAATCVMAIQVCDGGTPDLCASQTTTVTITAVNDAPTINSTAPPTATEDTLYTYNATRIDADGPSQTWSVIAGNTCAGSIVAATGVYTFTPAGPTPSATCAVAIQVCDNGTPNECTPQTSTITITAVNDAPVIVGTPPNTATEDTLYTFDFNRNDADGPSEIWTLLAGHTCGGSIDAAGVVSFTPAGPTPPASCVLAVQLCDGGAPNLCATSSTTIAITAVNDAPVVNSTPPATATEDTLYTYNATRNDPDGVGQTWSLFAGHTCAGSIVANTGVFTFTPAGPTPAANCVISIQVCDDGALCGTQTTTITINAVNDAPVINSTPPLVATEDTLYTYPATRNDLDGPQQIWALLAGHTCGGAIDAGTGVFTFTPAGPQPATSCVVSIQVCDGAAPSLCAAQTTTITVVRVNDAPTITSTAPPVATEDTQYTYNATFADGDGPSVTWSLIAGTNTCGGTIGATTGLFQFTPAGPAPNATCVAALQVCDNGTPNQCDTQLSTITINPVNDPPVINSVAPTTATEDTLYTYNASIIDTDGPAESWTILGSTNCPNASIVATTGVFTFTPPGPVPITSCTATIRVCDEGTPIECVNQTFTVNVTAVNDAPVINSSPPPNATEDTAYTYNATRNDPDGPGQTWTTIAGNTCNGSIVAGTGVYTFTPAGPTPPATCVIAVQVCDGAPGLCDTQSTTINIIAVNDLPTSTNDSVTTSEDTPLLLATTDFGNYSDPEGTGLASVRITALETDGSLEFDPGTGFVPVTLNQDISAANIALGRLRFVPSPDESGVSYATVGFRVSDGTDLSASAFVLTINVTPVNDPPTSSDDTASMAEDGTLALAGANFGSYSDIEGTALAAVQITALQTDGSLVFDTTGSGNFVAVTLNQVITAAQLAAGRLRFLPSANENGAPYATIGFRVGDGAAFSVSSFVLTINVNAVNDAPTSTNATISTNEDTTRVLTTTDFGTYFDIDGNALAAVQISTLETDGSLEFNPGSGFVPVTANQVISAADITSGKLRFVPDPNESGSPYATVGFRVSDGTAFSASAFVLTINVTPVNDAPTSTNDSVTTNEDTTRVLTTSDFGTYFDTEGSALASVRITTLETNGSLEFDPGTGFVPVTLNQDISAADIAGNRLRFVPDPNESGTPYTTIGFRVSDGTDVSASALVLTINVTPTNDPIAISTTPSSTTTDEGIEFSYDADATDIDGPAENWSVGVNDTCPGSAITASGVYTFTPIDTSPCNVEIIVCDGASPTESCATQNFQVTINVANVAPVIEHECANFAFVDVDYSCFPDVTVDSDDGPTKIWTLESGSTCGATTIDSVTGEIHFTIEGITEDGACTLNFTVCDGAADELCTSEAISIDVFFNDPPQIESTPDLVAVDDEVFTYAAFAGDSEGGNLTWSVLVPNDTCGGDFVDANTYAFTVPPAQPAPPFDTCNLAVQVCDDGAPNRCTQQQTTITIIPAG